jgi:hypothetical protein
VTDVSSAWPPEDLSFLKPHQVALFKVLVAQDEAIARIYAGAIKARLSEDNPDHISQCCHSIRELIDNIPKYFNVPVERTDKLGNKVDALHAAWKKEPSVRNTTAEPLSTKFMKKLEEFFAWHSDNRANRRAVASLTILKLDLSGRQLPPPLSKLRADEWMLIRDFFVVSAHHGTCTLEEVDQYLYFLEDFLLALIKPRTFDTADLIDALVKEVEDG